jgi:ribose 5-phosphate isomerase B
VGVRAALCWETEISALAKQHNDANVICLPARFISQEKAFAIVDAYLNMDFEGGRHLSRVNKIEG